MGRRVNIKRYLIQNPLNVATINLLSEISSFKGGAAFSMITSALRNDAGFTVFARKVECGKTIRCFLVKRKYYNGNLIEIPTDITENIFISKLRYEKDHSKFSVRKRRYAFYHSDMLCELDIYHDLHDGLKILNIFPKDPNKEIDLKAEFPPFLRRKKELLRDEFNMSYLMNNNLNQMRDI